LSNEIENPFAPPKTDASRAPVAVNAQEEFRARLRGDSRGRRVAGWFLIASAAVSVIALFAPEMRTSPLSIGLDVLVGVMLLRGYGSAANFALFRIALGLLFAIIGTFRGQSDAIVFMIPYATGFALLVIGNPGKARFVVGCVFVSLYLILFAGAAALLMTREI
jgi:hypothetical protein